MATSVIISNVQHHQTPAVVAVYANQWSTGICGCFDDLHVCCFAYWCFPCFACNTTSAFGEFFCLPMVDVLWNAIQMASIPLCTPPISMAMRVAVRHRYGIHGDMLSDCVYVTACNICSWCQMAREIKRRTQSVTVINAQPTVLSGQTFMLATQPGVIVSQPGVIASQPGVIASNPGVIASHTMVSAASAQTVLTSNIM